MNTFAPLFFRTFLLRTVLILSTTSIVVAGATASAELSARLTARPFAQTSGASFAPGLYRLNLAAGRDGTLYIPSSYRPSKPSPLVVFLHGSTGDSKQGELLFRNEAEKRGVIFLFPESRKYSWDLATDRAFGPDVQFLDQALKLIFSRLSIDAKHLALAGFSDGGSYTLSLGRTNGDLFSHLIAFSPGFMRPQSTAGLPAVFLIHGTADHVLPIEKCGRPIAAQLRAAGYAVDYHEFDGDHVVTPDGKSLALDWFLR